mgnify:CR=1 FL=1
MMGDFAGLLSAKVMAGATLDLLADEKLLLKAKEEFKRSPWSQLTALMALPDQERQPRQSKTGWPLPGMSLSVVDGERNDVAQDGVTVGEIVAMGDHVMDGYFNDPAATQALRNAR